MLSTIELKTYCDEQNLPNDTVKIIEEIRSSQPSRKVHSWKKSVSGFYPSRKMGVTIQFESHKCELPFIYELEHNSEVLEYYEQPPSFKLKYDSKSGRKTVVYHTADFFVIEKTRAYWVECKTENALFNLAVKQPNRFELNDEVWICPPGKQYANQYGLDYVLWSDSQINWIFLRNIEYLEDYFLGSKSTVTEENYKYLRPFINEFLGIKLSDLIEKVKNEINIDQINELIAYNKIFVDLNNELLTDPINVQVFYNFECFKAYQNTLVKSQIDLSSYSNDFVLEINEHINWDGNTYRIINTGEDEISLYSEKNGLVQFPRYIFQEAVKKGKIVGSENNETNQLNKQILKILSEASEEQLSEANKRYEFVMPYLTDGNIPSTFTQSTRTLLRWSSSYKTADQI